MAENELRYVDSNDSRLLAQNISIQSFNQSTEQIKENKREIYSKIYYSTSLIFAVLMLVFSELFGIITFFILLDGFLVFLIYHAKQFYVRRRELAVEHEKLRKNLNEWGLNVKSL